jgi:hypothetical protein
MLLKKRLDLEAVEAAVTGLDSGESRIRARRKIPERSDSFA